MHLAVFAKTGLFPHFSEPNGEVELFSVLRVSRLRDSIIFAAFTIVISKASR